MKYIFTLNEFFVEKLNSDFYKWFNGSKIVEDDKPLLCYHGTYIKDIQIFDIDKVGYNTGNYGHYGYGIYFSTDIREAKGYGDIIYECYLNIKNPFTGADEDIMQLKEYGVSLIDDLIILSIDYKSLKDSFKNDKDVYNFIDSLEKNGSEYTWNNIDKNLDLDKFNDIQHLLDYTTINKNVHGVHDEILDKLKEYDISPKLNRGFDHHQSLHWITDLGNNSKEVTDAMKKLGYDGVWYGSEIVAFYPSQINIVNIK